MHGDPTDREQPAAREDRAHPGMKVPPETSPVPEGVDEAFDEVYQQLRELASVYMRRQRPDHTLQATALTHEAYLRLRRRSTARWSNRSHFLGIAARAMRQILIDHERLRLAEKRGAGARKLSLNEVATLSMTPQPDLLELNLALDKLAAIDARKARVVELLYFGGLTAIEAAEVLGVTSRTVERDWKFARVWLYRQVSGNEA